MPTQITATADSGKALYAVIQQGTQVYPAISPVGATIDSNDFVPFTIVGLPTGVTVHLWEPDGGDIVLVTDTDSSAYDPTALNQYASWGGSQSTTHVVLDCLLSDGSRVSTTLTVNNGGPTLPGTPVPPGSAVVYRTDTHAFEPEDDANYAFYAVPLTEVSAGNYAANFPAEIGAGEYSYSVREVGQVYPAVSPVGQTIHAGDTIVLTVVGMPDGYSVDDQDPQPSGSPAEGSNAGSDNVSLYAHGGTGVVSVTVNLYKDGSSPELHVAGGFAVVDDADALVAGTPIPPPPGYAPSDTTLSTAAVTIAPTAPAGPYARRSLLEKPMTVKQGTTPPVLFLLIASATHIVGLTGAAPTLALSKAGGTFAAPVGTVSEVGNGWYKFLPAPADTDTFGELILHAAATGADPSDTTVQVVGFDPNDTSKFVFNFS